MVDATPRTAAAVILLLLVCSVACHKRLAVPVAPRPVDPTSIADRFEQLITEGCYLCLADVLHEFRALPEPLQHAPVVRHAVDRAALLFVLRRKELGILPDEEWDFAGTLIAGAAPDSPVSPLLAEVAQAIPWNVTGVGEGFLDRNQAAWLPSAKREAWKAALALEWPQNDVAAYVFVSHVCSLGRLSSGELSPIRERYRDSPLILYRAATCQSSNEAVLRQLLAENPRFQEVRYFVGRSASNTRRWADAYQELLGAWQSIPRFSAAGVMAAELALTVEDFGQSLEAFEAVLALAPDHFRAVLGKLKTLSSAGRHVEAVAVASQLIASGGWFQGDAYYWRAWNEYQLGSTEPALNDVRAAKDFEKSVRVFALAGLLRMKQEHWEDARQEFRSARALNRDACDVALYLGYTESSLAAWKESAGTFESAAGCFSAAESSMRAQLAALANQPVDSWTTKQAARLRRDLAAAIEQEQSSVYNAAVSFVNARLPERARPYAERAEGIPAYAERARVLLGLINDRH